MPRIIRNRTSSQEQIVTRTRRPFQCRICKHFHPLRKCNKFLSMGISQRKQAVERFNYCLNCLAHKHSKNACFSKSGCHICRRQHHTLLHERQIRQRVADPTTLPALPSIVHSQNVTILPTALVKISLNGRLHQVRALIDTGSAVSRIAKSIVTKYKIPTHQMDGTLICQVVIRANSDRHARISTSLRVDNRISMSTPAKSLPTTIKDKFLNLVLADPMFFESAPISVVLGADVYPKVILGGVIPNHEGIPMVQNSVFGWLISGIYHH